MADTAPEKGEIKSKTKEKVKNKDTPNESPKDKKEMAKRMLQVICLGCEGKFLSTETNKLCGACKEKIKGTAGTGSEELRSWMKDAMVQVFESLSQDKQHKDTPAEESLVYDSISSDESVEPGPSKYKPDSESDYSDMEDFFPIEDIDSLIVAVRETMGLEDTSEPPKKSSKLFANINKRKVCFPLDDAIKGKIKNQWSNLDRKFILQKKFNMLFPFDVADSKPWDNAPKLDPPVAQTIKRTTLPLEDSTGLRDPMDRKADGALRKTFLAAAAGFKPAVAAASVARSLKVWITQLEKALKKGVSRDKLLADLPMLSSAADFLTEASLASIDILSKSTAFATSARRAIWLKPWIADIASKNRLLNLPFEGEKLFGSELESLVEKKSDDKVKCLPQDKRSAKRSFRGFRTSYRYRQDWRNQKTSKDRSYGQFRGRSSRGRGRTNFHQRPFSA
ncbi:uncharacterized protein LOC108714053 isoform X2 [Xenopus laevis]|uniref:Uncharacterized protein LOC108714053 isoform X2 n=1 Tax=Xenopus laevis TaxID=8355 RepID=A0A8J1MU84_XENLA|nr:uncharacterized protein LOC108714053 isoform X2 [Xenopus laevis]